MNSGKPVDSGKPSYLQCYWLSERMKPILDNVRALHINDCGDEMKKGLYDLEQELNSMCLEFSTLVWSKGIQPSHDVLVVDPLYESNSVSSASPSTVHSSSSNSTFNTTVAKKVTEHSQPSRTFLLRKPSLKKVSFTSYTTKASRPLVLKTKKKKRTRKKRGTTNTSEYVRVENLKELLSYLKDHHFESASKGKSKSRSHDVRYERYICGCGECADVLFPETTCGKKMKQYTNVTTSNTSNAYFRNKKSDVDRLIAQALALRLS